MMDTGEVYIDPVIDHVVDKICIKLESKDTKKSLGSEAVERVNSWIDKIDDVAEESYDSDQMVLHYYCSQLLQQVEKGKLQTPFDRPPPKDSHIPCFPFYDA